VVTVSTVKEYQHLYGELASRTPRCSSERRSTSWSAQLLITDATPSRLYVVPAEAEGYTVQSVTVAVIGRLDAECRLATRWKDPESCDRYAGSSLQACVYWPFQSPYCFNLLLAPVPKLCSILCLGSGFCSPHSPCSISSHRGGYLGSAVYRSAL
jgi:hypothetical protein